MFDYFDLKLILSPNFDLTKMWKSNNFVLRFLNQLGLLL